MSWDGRKPVLVFSTPRAGTNFVCSVLGAYLRPRGMAGLRELFGLWHTSVWDTGSGIHWAGYVKNVDQGSYPADVVQQIIDYRMRLIRKYHGRYFFKVFPFQIDFENFSELARTYHVICLERGNLFEQALSLAFATSTRSWVRLPGAPAQSVPEGSLTADLNQLDAMETQILSYRAWREQLGLAHVFHYEDLCRLGSPAEMVSRLLGVPVPPLSDRFHERQVEGSKLEAFGNADDIVRWYRESRLQKIAPIELKPRKSRPKPPPLAALVVLEALSKDGVKDREIRNKLEGICAALPGQRLGVTFSYGYDIHGLHRLPGNLEVIRIGNPLLDVPLRDKYSALKKVIRDRRPSVVVCEDTTGHCRRALMLKAKPILAAAPKPFRLASVAGSPSFFAAFLEEKSETARTISRFFPPRERVAAMNALIADENCRPSDVERWRKVARSCPEVIFHAGPALRALEGLPNVRFGSRKPGKGINVVLASDCMRNAGLLNQALESGCVAVAGEHQGIQTLFPHTYLPVSGSKRAEEYVRWLRRLLGKQAFPKAFASSKIRACRTGGLIRK